jgi:hypothetical protein
VFPANQFLLRVSEMKSITAKRQHFSLLLSSERVVAASISAGGIGLSMTEYFRSIGQVQRSCAWSSQMVLVAGGECGV